MERRISNTSSSTNGPSSKVKQKLLPFTHSDERLDIASIQAWLWDAAHAIRGATDAPKFRDFILPLIAYKRLSDLFDEEFAACIEKFGDETTAEEIIAFDYEDALTHGRAPIMRFYIPSECRWSVLSNHPADGRLGEFVNHVMRKVAQWNPALQELLDIRDYSERQSGVRTLEDEGLAACIQVLSRYCLGSKDVESALLGEAFEDLLRKFAEGKGHRSGEFYTPKEIVRLIAELIDPKPYSTIFDGACGSGGMLVRARQFFEERHPQEKSKAPVLYGQDLNPATVTIAKMNLFLHGYIDAHIAAGDTFRHPRFIAGEARNQKFDYVISNPPWNQDHYGVDLYEHDPWGRFNFGIPPRSTADWGWIQLFFASLNDQGRAALLLDTGVVSRGSGNKSFTRERDIRKRFVEEDIIEAVISLPENLFDNISAPGVLLLLNRNKQPERRMQILLIDASAYLSTRRPKKQLTENGIAAISTAYRNWQTLPGVSRVITIDDIRDAGYNLHPSQFIRVSNEAQERTLGRKLQALRQRANLSEKDLADLIDSTISLLQSLESDSYIPTSPLLRELIQVYLLHNTFTEGIEQEEVEKLWELAREAGMKGLFDEKWFKELLARKQQQAAMSPVTLFCTYAREDEAHFNELEQHLALLRRQGFITEYHFRRIIPGATFDGNPDYNFTRASIILFLVSPNFLASDYLYSEEMMHALERRKVQEASVFPIILQPVDWGATSLAHLQVLPRDAKPITLWANKDEAYLDVARSLRRICEDLQAVTVSKQGLPIKEDRTIPPSQLPIFRLYEVFVRSTIPKLTFVKIEDFDRLKLSLEEPRRGVVIEGPSGIGKTTAIQKAIEELTHNKRPIGTVSSIQVLSARNPEHREKIQTLVQWHRGTVIIDDFHRLDLALRNELTDYLKYLADTEPISKKLVIVGIPQTGRRLVETAHDIAARIDVFKLGLVRDELIQQMIEKGEKALNIKFERKAEIVLAANGSLNIAQFLCYDICYRHITSTQERLQQVSCNLDEVVSSVINELSRKFGDAIKYFASLGEPNDATMILLLDELANSEDGILSLRTLKERRPSLARGIDRFLDERWIDKLYSVYPESINYFFFDQEAQNLVIEDPQLTFYLKKQRLSSLSREAGKSPRLAQRKIFISYTLRDIDWLDRLKVHLKPIEREGIIELWDDTKIMAGARRKDELQEALYTSRVAVVLVSAEFLASDFISEHVLPKLLSRAAYGGTTIIPIIISPCLFDRSELSVFQTIRTPNGRPLTALKRAEQEQILVNVAETILEVLEKDDA